jgi:cytochrome P450
MSKTLADLPVVEFSGADIMSGQFPRLQAQAALEHGPIFKWPIRAGADAGDYVFMVGPEANRFVLHTHREHFSHAIGWTPLLGPSFGTGLLNMDDPEHARHRKMWNPAFAGAAIESYLPLLHQVIVERTRTWPARREVDVYEEAREITFDAAAGALAGMRLGPAVDRLRGLFYTLLHGFEGEGSWDEIMGRLYQAQLELDETLLGLIRAQRRLPPAEQPHDVLSMILNARDEQGRTLDDEQVRGHLNILLVAGHETTTTLGAWTLYLLATQSEHRARVLAELDAVLGNSAGPPTGEQIRALKVLDNVVKEAGRLYPPVINVPRGVLHDFEFGGYTIPAGTPVRLALAAGHRLPQVFANPDAFDPDRFAPPREEDKKTPYSLVTFGGGSRICIGINFAQIEVKTLVAHVLRMYRLTPVPSQQIVHAGHWNATLPNGIRMRVNS